uniref:Uncharacterized protein n=1 Tax=Magallana gigas TaxID=29159 RepID=K1Q1B0_MAGGI
MADNETGSSSGAGSGLVDKMTVIAETVQELQKGQQSLQSMVESKFDKLKNEFLANIDNKFKAMRSDIDLKLGMYMRKKKILSQNLKSLFLDAWNVWKTKRGFNI